VTRDRLIDGRNIVAGDVVVGLPSSGVHSNGFSLVRKIVQQRGLRLDLPIAGRALGDVLLEPTALYVRQVLALYERHPLKGVAHITGGGFENIDRVLPAGLACRVRQGSWPVPPIFEFLQLQGGIDAAEMRRVFNMGVGMALVVAAEHAAALLGDAPEAFVFADVVSA
jgi:phosphoribosylformylglycinamidine cyclo-ligase